MVKPVADANACTTNLESVPVPVSGVTRCRVCGRNFVGWNEEKSRRPTYWIGKQACSEECVREATWRDSLRQLNLDYYPDPRYYDKLGRPLPSWMDPTLGS